MTTDIKDKCKYPEKSITIEKEIPLPNSVGARGDTFIFVLEYHEVADFPHMIFVTSLLFKYIEPFGTSYEYKILHSPLHSSLVVIFLSHITKILSLRSSERKAKDFTEEVLLEVLQREPRLTRFLWEVSKYFSWPPKKNPIGISMGFLVFWNIFNNKYLLVFLIIFTIYYAIIKLCQKKKIQIIN